MVKKVVKKINKIEGPIYNVSNIGELEENDLENLTALMYKKRGYHVEREVFVKGISNQYLIDLYAEKNKYGFFKVDSLIAEIKNSRIGVNEVKNFLVICQDIMSKINVKKCYLITNKIFTQNALDYAKKYDIKTMDQKELVEELKVSGLV
jgi:hypothetical protein